MWNTVLLIPFWKFSIRKIVDRVVLDVLAEVRLPPHAVVDGHAVRHAPRVLRVQPQVPVVDEQQVLAAMLERRHTADEKVRECRARSPSR